MSRLRVAGILVGIVVALALVANLLVLWPESSAGWAGRLPVRLQRLRVDDCSWPLAGVHT